jgi:tetratricopeptide (TPR) repeat protein
MRHRNIAYALMATTLLIQTAFGASEKEWKACEGADNNPGGAITACTRILQGKETSHNRAVAYDKLCVAWREKKEYDRAIADCDQALRLDPRYAWAMFDRARAYEDKGDVDHAIADFTAAIKLDPKGDQGCLACSYNGRGICWKDKGDLDRAISDYNQAIRIDPKLGHAYANRARAWRAKAPARRPTRSAPAA